MRNQTATARPVPADTRSARHQADPAADTKVGKAVKPTAKPPARQQGSIEPAPALEVSAGPALLEGPTRDELIRNRAFERYERSGRVDGNDVDDWLAAEAEVCAITKPGASGAVTRRG